MSFAILQKSLDQSIDRRLLEEISTSVPSVARADCARLAREWFGIVVQNISRDEATVFSRLLNAKGFPTEVVRQHELPLLPSPVRRRGLNWDGRVLTAADGMGREQSFPMEGVRFAAGGFVARQSLRSKKVMEWDVRYSYRGTVSRQVVMRDDDELVRETVFRFELFLGCEPFRLQFPVEEESLLRVRGEVLRFRQKDRLAELLREWGKLMPEDGRNLGIQAVLDGAALIYPSPAAFEEEIVWRLFQALRGDGQ